MRNILPDLDWIREDTDQKKLRIWTLFTQSTSICNSSKSTITELLVNQYYK